MSDGTAGMKDGPEFAPSHFTASGLPALEISQVQQAALEAAKKQLLTPQKQLELLKSDREKRGKGKSKASKL